MRAIIAASLLLATFVSPTLAHDHWINAGRYRSPVDGMLCCGEHDCLVIPMENVKATPIGYQLPGGETIPYAETLQSEDGNYHRCHKPDGSRRCFFAPVSAS